MHLTILSDSYVSDQLGDAGTATGGLRHARDAHLDGLVRGVVFAIALLTPFALTFGPAAFGKGTPAEMGTRP